MFGFIYITTNLVNQKRYLGRCRYGKRDWETYLGSGKAIKRAIKKYGNENFSRVILIECSTKELLIEKEKELISQYNCVDDAAWYNISPDSHTTRGFAGKRHSEETKQKMRDSYKKPVISEQGKLNIAKSNSERIKLYNATRDYSILAEKRRGLKFSDEWRANISAARRRTVAEKRQRLNKSPSIE
jgi:group I intron endonuclease